MRFLAVLAALSVAAVPSFADCVRFRARVVQKVVVAEFVPVVVAVPQYSVGYADDGLREELARLRSEVAALKAPPAGIVASRCASCHGADVATTRGGKFVLGGRRLGAEEIAKVLSRTRDASHGARMPKGGKPLSPDETLRLIEELVQ